MESSYFFNTRTEAPVEYSAEDFAAFFGNMLTNGVITKDGFNSLKVVHKSGYVVSVLSGTAMINGYQYCNSEELELSAESVSTDEQRIDRVVLRLDLNDATNNIKAYIVKGTADAAPELTRDTTTWELSLATLTVTQSGVSVEDNREDKELCGLCTFIVQYPVNECAVAGTYIGDGAESKFINLGFTPSAVVVYSPTGSQYAYNSSSWDHTYNGGLALQGYDCCGAYGSAITISEGGFYVYKSTYESNSSNAYIFNTNSASTHYFIAYRNLEIMHIE